MGKATESRRRFEIRRKNEGKQKLKELKEKYSSTSDASKKKAIIEKVKRLAPHVEAEKYLKA